MQIPEVIKKLSIDLETYSSVPIKYGVYHMPNPQMLRFFCLDIPSMMNLSS